MRKRILKRFVEGDYVYSVTGGFPELFLRLCRNEKITLRDVNAEGNTVTCKVNHKDEEAFLRAAAESGMEILNVRKFGLRYLCFRYKNRIGIPIGILLFIIILRILSSVLWSVNVQGLTTINEEDIISYLDSIHIKKGTRLSDIDCNAIEEKIELFNHAVLRCAVNLAGCKLYISVEERNMPPDIAERNRYCNVVAGKGGEVLSVDILAGAGNVHPGDILRVGDLIAEGVIPLKNGGIRLLEAQAIVIAKTETVFQAATEAELTVKKVTHVSDRYAVSFFGFTVPPFKEKTENTEYLSAEETVLPVGITRYRSTAFENRTAALTESEASLLTMEKLARAASIELWGKKIVGCNVSCSAAGYYEIDAQFFCEEDIARQQFFESNSSASQNTKTGAGD